MFSTFQIYDTPAISAQYHHSYIPEGQLKLIEVNLREQSHSLH